MGNFFLTLQKKPKTVLDLTMEMQEKKAEYSGMTYYYAMSVFYRIDKNPHGPSHRPIMIVALEHADMGVLARMLGSEAGELLQAEIGSKMGPLWSATRRRRTDILRQVWGRPKKLWLCPGNPPLRRNR